jgi:peptidoglycan biosynthesis protein MviN/MurJ (putative lipid II flippase)
LAACFARQQPRIPLFTGLVSMLAYLAVALPGAARLGMPALAFANAAQHATNALLLLGWLAGQLPIFVRTSHLKATDTMSKEPAQAA